MAAPTLLTADGRNPGQVTVDVGPQGLELLLRLGAGDELDAATVLRLLPDPGPGGTPVSEETLDAVLSSSAGALVSDQAVSWVAADWGVERPLCGLNVGAPAGKARVKVFTAGVWLPLMPGDLVDTGSEQRFPPVLASKVMVELVVADAQFPALWKPSTAKVTGLAVRAATLPGELSLSLGAQPAFFRSAGLLPAAGLRVPALSAAVNAALVADADNVLRLLLKAGTPGKLRLSFQPVAQHVLRRPELELPLGWAASGQAVGVQGLGLQPPGAQITELVFAMKAELPPVMLLGAESGEVLAQACYAGSADGVAQAFVLQEPPAPVIGLDLPLGRRSGALAGRVALHPDLDGCPSPQPYGGAELALAWPAGADPRGANGWLSLDFPRPLKLPDATWWVVLTLSEGEAWWFRGTPAPASAGGCVYRQGEAPWLPMAPQPSRWAAARLRLLAPQLSPTLVLKARRGGQEVVLQPDELGQVRADAQALQVLNRDADTQLELRAEASCAGRLVLSGLRLACK